MDPLVAAGAVMIWLSVTLILYMTYLGFDIRSRGFTASGPAFATLPKLGITIRDYYRKRGEHPVTDQVNAKKAKVFRVLTLATSIFVIALIVLIIVVW